MSEKENFHLRIDPDLRRRIDILRKDLRIHVKRGNTTRDAYVNEFLVLAAEYCAARMERGLEVMKDTESFPAARQVRDGTLVELAPLVSGILYKDLSESPRVPTDGEMKLLEIDACHLTSGMPVVVRGSVFHTPTEMLHLNGYIHEVQRGARGPRVMFENSAEGRIEEQYAYGDHAYLIEVSPYDLVPSIYGP